MRGQCADNTANVFSTVDNDSLCRENSPVKTAYAVSLDKAVLGYACDDKPHPVKVSIKESYAKIENGEMIVYGMNISPYEQGNRFNVDPLMPRKLLLHKQEIRKLIGYTTLKGLTIVPLTVYINEDGRAKMEIAVARGKKLYDKRDDIAKRDAERRMAKAARY